MKISLLLLALTLTTCTALAQSPDTDTTRIAFLTGRISHYIDKVPITPTDLDSAAPDVSLLLPLLPAARTAADVWRGFVYAGSYFMDRGDRKRAIGLWLQGWQRLRAAGDIVAENRYVSRIAFHAYHDTASTPMVLSLVDQLKTDNDSLLPHATPETQQDAIMTMSTIGSPYYYSKQTAAFTRIETLTVQVNRHLHQHVVMPYSWLAYLCTNEGRTKEGLEYALEAVSVSETPGAPVDGSAYECASRIFYVIGDYDKSQEYIYKALALFRKNPGLTHNAGGLFNRAVNILLRQHKPAEGLNLLRLISRPIPGSPFPYQDAEYFLVSSGDCFYALGRTDSAEHYYREALKYLLIPGFSPQKAIAYNSLAAFYTGTRQYTRARPYLDTLTADSNRALITLTMLDKAYLLRYRADSAVHDNGRALADLRNYQAVHDSLVNVAKNDQLAEINIRYETEKKNQHIADLEKQNALQTKLQQSTVRQDRIVRNSLIAGAALLALFAAVLYNRWRARHHMSIRLEKLSRCQQKLLTEKETLLCEKEKLIGEKEWLLREIHHRVKNNLQIIISLLNMQRCQLRDETAISAFEEIGARVNAISLVHKKLYQEGQDMASIAMREYVSDLVSFLQEGLCLRGIRFHLDIAPDLRQSSEPSLFPRSQASLRSLVLDVAQCVPIGLIVNEAVTNSIKYAFPPGLIPSPMITISLKEESPGWITLVIADNGIGLPRGFDPGTSTSLGLRLIHTLCSQLDGSLTMDNQPGLTLSLHFPNESAPAGAEGKPLIPTPPAMKQTSAPEYI